MTAILAEYSVPQPDYVHNPSTAAGASVVALLAVALVLGFAWNRFRDAEQRDLHATKLLFAKSALAATQAKPVALIPVPDVEPVKPEPEPVEPEPEPAAEPQLVLAGRHADPQEAKDVGYVGRRYANTDGDTQVIRRDGSWPA